MKQQNQHRRPVAQAPVTTGRSVVSASQPVQRIPAVQKELGILHGNIGDLIYLVGELEDRLGPVVVPPPGDMGGSEPSTTSAVPLVSRLEDLNAQVNLIAARMRSLRDRVEV